MAGSLAGLIAFGLSGRSGTADRGDSDILRWEWACREITGRSEERRCLFAGMNAALQGWSQRKAFDIGRKRDRLEVFMMCLVVRLNS